MARRNLILSKDLLKRLIPGMTSNVNPITCIKREGKLKNTTEFSSYLSLEGS
jgi:hypothetical protein